MNCSEKISENKKTHNSVLSEWKRTRRQISTLNLVVDVFIIGLFMGLTPAMFIYADMMRGYDATGGELFIPFVGVGLVMFTNYLFSSHVKRIERMIKEGVKR